jgi:rhodanese-related sulfurtransferase
MKLFTLCVGVVMTLSCVIAEEDGSNGFEYAGVPIQIVSAQGKVKNLIVKRHIPDICKKVSISNETLWTGDFAHKDVPKACKSTYVHAKGKLLPMQIHYDIDTYGELEVLAFIKHMQTDDSMMLVDGRKQSWYDYRTIPGSVNIPFHHLKEREAFEFEFEDALNVLGVVVHEDDNEQISFEFNKAKTIVIYCNGPWCTQSVTMIDSLLEIGYPADRIKWYRGGIQAWLAAGMTSTRDE